MGDEDSFRQRVLYSFGRIGGGIYDGFNTAILSLYLGGLTNNTFLIGYLSSAKTMEGVVVQPIVGRWSDRTKSRLGRRKPFIIVAAPLSALFLILAAHAGHLGGSLGLLLVAVTIILFSIFYNIAGDPYDALMVDITPQRKRATFNAVLNIISLLGFIAIDQLASHEALKKNSIPDSVFYVTAAAIVFGYLVVVLGVREPKDAAREASTEEHIPLRAYVDEMRTFREAFKFLLADFFFWNGIFTILGLLNRYMEKSVGVTKSEALNVFAIMIVVSAICAYPAARLGNRIGYKPVAVTGCALLIAASFLALLARSYAWLFPVAVLAGCGYGTVNALLYPYLASLVPGSKVGVFTGIRTSFSGVATPFSIGIASLLTLVFGLRAIFGVVAVAMACAIWMFLTINAAVAKRQVEEAVTRDSAMAGELPVAAS